MKRYSFFCAMAFLFAAVEAGTAQVCSTGSFQLFQDDKSVGGACTVTMFGTFVNVTETQGYSVKCTTTNGNVNPGSVYFSDSLKLTGNGQRFCGSLLSAQLFCDPIFSMTVTQATSVTDFHRFTFFEQDRTTGGSQCSLGGTQTLFRQCAGQPCNGTTTGGGGGSSGGCDPTTGQNCTNCTSVPLADSSLSSGPTGQLIMECDPGTSPIIIDTEAEGFHLTSAVNGVTFDISGTDHPIQIAWTDAHFHNAFLVLPGPDGLVHNGKELFGNFTPRPQSAHPNGFLALAQYDRPENGGNGDGIIDEHDQAFSQLRLWIDENHDGICQPNELHRLPELGVYSLALDYKESRRTDQFGNQFRYQARVNPGERQDSRDQRPHGEENEVGRWTYDVFFVTK